MAITISDTTPRVQYTATAGQTNFAVNFEFFVNGDIKVYNGTTLLTYDASPSSASEYSVSGAGQTGGGSITLGGGATVNDKITIYRDMAIARSTDFPTSGAFQVDSLNEELDKLAAMIQQVENDTKYSPKFSQTTTTGFNLTFPELSANKVISVNSGGTALEAVHAITDVATVAGIATAVSNVSSIASAVSAVNSNSSNVNTVAGSISSVNTLAGISGLDTLAGNSANVTTAATNIASINTNATNITAIQNASTNANTATTKAAEAAASAASAAASAGGGAIKVSSNDAAPDVLNTKLLVAGGLTKTEGNDGGNETLTLTAQAAEVYGFEIVDEATNPTLRITTTDGGDDNISSTAYAAFDDVIYGASGMSWSITADGDLRVTI